MTVRYKNSVEPVWTDGRDIDLEVGSLTGEGADQESSGASGEHMKAMAQPWTQLPEPRRGDPTYYDRPMLNAPVWESSIPMYYYIGGVTGAALVVGAAAQLTGSTKLNRLIRRCHWIGFIGASVSGILLIRDLGKPSRFFNMLRVFRPTSPMNMGAWILSGVGATSAPTLLLRGRDGLLGSIGDAFGIASGVFGMALATYTGVLVANTAVPVWQESRRVLPILFGASAMSSVGSLFEMFIENTEERRITKVFGAVGQAAEIVASVVMEKQASVVPRVGRPLKRGLSGTMWRTAGLLTAGSLIVGALRNKTRQQRIAGGVLGTLGSLLMRFAVEHAGVVSARDARASFHQQRAGHGAAEVARTRASIS
jgi:formate-dependent nitrite reductase membrane component NrfD